MRHLTRMFTISAVLILGLVAVGAAQMMGGGHGNMMTTTTAPDTTAQQGNANFMTMMNNMSNHNQMMNRDFDKLEAGFNQMMQMNDMPALKSELKNEQMMVQEMHKNMGQQETMLQHMENMMSSGGQGMMGQHQGMMNQSSMGNGMTGMHANNNTSDKDTKPKSH